MLNLLNYQELFIQPKNSDDQQEAVELVIGLDSEHDKKKVKRCIKQVSNTSKILEFKNNTYNFRRATAVGG